MERDSMLSVRIPREVRDAVKRAGADDDGRSLSNMVVKVLRLYCEERGYLKHSPADGVDRREAEQPEDLAGRSASPLRESASAANGGDVGAI